MADTYKLVDGKVRIIREKKVKGVDTGIEIVAERKEIKTEQTKTEYLAQLNAMKTEIENRIKEVNKLK